MITILLMLMFGIIDIGRALFTENNLVSAAREGARYGAASTNPPDTNAVRATVIAHFSPFGGPALTATNIKMTLLPAGGATYESIRVKISYPFKWITPIQKLVGKMTDTLHAQAEYHLEQQ